MEPRSSRRYVIRNASILMLNMFGVQVGGLLLGGVFVVEYIFDYPGVGKLTIRGRAPARFPDHSGCRDPRRLRALVLTNILVDLIATYLD